MEYRTLGNTDLQLSAITYGAFAIGGNMWGKLTADEIGFINKELEKVYAE